MAWRDGGRSAAQGNPRAESGQNPYTTERPLGLAPMTRVITDASDEGRGSFGSLLCAPGLRSPTSPDDVFATPSGRYRARNRPRRFVAHRGFSKALQAPARGGLKASGAIRMIRAVVR